MDDRIVEQLALDLLLWHILAPLWLDWSSLLELYVHNRWNWFRSLFHWSNMLILNKYQCYLPIRSSFSCSGNKFRWSLFSEHKLWYSESIVVVLDVIEVLVNCDAVVSNDVLLEPLPIRNFNLNGAIRIVKWKLFFNLGLDNFKFSFCIQICGYVCLNFCYLNIFLELREKKICRRKKKRKRKRERDILFVYPLFRDS